MPTATKHPALRHLSKDLIEEMNTLRVSELKESLEAYRDRNEDFISFDAQLRGDPYWAGIAPRWRGGSEVEDPITTEHHMEQVAYGMAYIGSTQWWTSDANTDEDEEEASAMEAWLNDKVYEYRLSGVHGYDLLYNRARHGYGVLYCGWKQEYETTYTTMYRDRDSKLVVEAEDRVPGHKYEQIEETVESVKSDGLDLRVPHGTDFGFYPPDAQSVKDADFTWERLDMSLNQLLDGISDEGFDKDRVKDVLTRANVSTTDSTYRKERNEADGIINIENGLVDVYLCVGRPPLILIDGEPQVAAEARRRDWMWLIAGDTVIKFEPLPYDCRPYAIFPFMREPGRMMADGVCSIVAPLQREASIEMRFRIDGRDVAMSPSLLVPMEAWRDLQKYSVYPGAMIPYESTWPGGSQSIVPLKMDTTFFGAALQGSNDTRMRAAQIFSAQARGSVSGVEGDKTAQEIRQSASGADEKQDLFMANWHFGTDDLWPIIISHYRKFKPEDTVRVGSKTISTTPEMLKKSFRIQSHSSNTSSNPDAKLARAKLIYDFILQNPIIVQKVQQGDMTGLHEASQTVLRDLGVRNPAIILGKPPTAPPTADFALQQIMAAVEQGAQVGDRFALQLMVLIRQMQSSGGMPPDQSDQGQAKQKISESINFKDLAPNQKDAFAAMVNLPPAGKTNGSGGNPNQPAQAGMGAGVG